MTSSDHQDRKRRVTPSRLLGVLKLIVSAGALWLVFRSVDATEVWNRFHDADPKWMADFIARELPFGRLGRPDELGATVAFLASPKASWVSGTTVVVDGCQSRMF